MQIATTAVVPTPFCTPYTSIGLGRVAAGSRASGIGNSLVSIINANGAKVLRAGGSAELDSQASYPALA